MLMASEWTRFRGPNGQGIGTGADIPVTWSDADLNWKTKLPGYGHSSPVVWENRIFVTSADADAQMCYLLAIDRLDGKIVWQQKFSFATHHINNNNSFASSTPTVDKDHVYVLLPAEDKTVLLAFDHAGDKKWQKDFAGIRVRHGFGCSPVLVDELIIFTREQEKVKNSPYAGSWVAVDRTNGGIVWELPRETVVSNAYATPCTYAAADGSRQLIFTSEAHGFTAIEARTGRIIWELGDALDARAIASPVLAGNLIIGTCKSKLVAIDPGKSDEGWQPEVVYQLPRRVSPYVPTPVYLEGLLYNFVDNGYVVCVEATTGNVLWREKPAGKYFGSPILLGDRLYCMSTGGQVVVIRAGRSYQLLALNEMAEGSHATPAVDGGQLFLRTFSTLMSIGGAK
jgi:outer membrane protein assembly factor BamB